MAAFPTLVFDLLAAQHGLITRSQLLQRGCRSKVVDGWLRRGALVREYQGILRLPGAPQTPQQAILAAVLRGGLNARAGPRSSCALHGLEGFAIDGPVDVAVHPGRRLRPVPFRVLPMSVPVLDQETVHQVPVLAVTRSLVELGAELSERGFRVAFDSARRKGLTSTSWLRRRAQAIGDDHPGVAAALRILNSGILVPDGEGERRLQRVLDGFEPAPEWGVRDLVPDRRLDCVWRAVLLALEYDGRDHHMLPTDRDADGLRDLECAGYGVEVLRITKGMLDASPMQVRSLIERVYARRAREYGLAHA
ncbi:MAG: hypothetical protein ACRDU8_05955 [Egibacteraceae bacterium]